ncbi:hypothetical protein [Micromonospora sp. DT31]|uniref:hypothetical protein n=1 Tax=Micromonospora sp. DT31 TaxID=3393434 RepID=UPI003CF659B2
MGMSVQVREYGGVVVEQLTDAAGIASLCSSAASEPSRYPLLSGVDPYDDTWFNSRQTVRLATELQSIIDSGDDSVRAAAQAILQLASLLAAAPGRPHHRQLLFNGD